MAAEAGEPWRGWRRRRKRQRKGELVCRTRAKSSKKKKKKKKKRTLCPPARLTSRLSAFALQCTTTGELSPMFSPNWRYVFFSRTSHNWGWLGASVCMCVCLSTIVMLHSEYELSAKRDDGRVEIYSAWSAREATTAIIKVILRDLPRDQCQKINANYNTVYEYRVPRRKREGSSLRPFSISFFLDKPFQCPLLYVLCRCVHCRWSCLSFFAFLLFLCLLSLCLRSARLEVN